MMKKSIPTRRLTILAIFSAISAVLMYLDFPLPIFPSFLKIDFSDLPALLAAFLFGPLSGMTVELVKNLLHLLVTTTGGVGELANFLVGASLVGTAGLVYKLRKTKKGAIAGMALGTIAMAGTGILVNYFITLPFYVQVMGWPMQVIIDKCAAIIPFIQNKLDVVLWSITPFNLLKGVVMSVLTFALYKRLGYFVKKMEGDR